MFSFFKRWFKKSPTSKFSKAVRLKGELSAIAFVTQELRDHYILFLPISPTPTAGFTLIVAKERVEVLDIPVKDALELIISFGIVVPQELKEALEKD